MEQSLDAILNGETDQPEVEQAEVETLEAELVETEQEPQKVEENEADETTAPEDTKQEPWTKAAVLDERRKRQELERQLAELKESTQKAEAERPDIFEDQEGAFDYVSQQVGKQVMQARLDMSREMMSLLKDDYEDRESQFLDLAKETPELIEQLKRSPNPAKFAYDTAIKHEKLKQMENIDEYKAKLEAEIREKLEKELKQSFEAEAEQRAKKRESVPPSLAGQRSAEGMRVDAGIDQSLSEILGR